MPGRHAAAQDARFDVLALGEPLVCLSASPGRLEAARTLTKSIGGAEANVAIGLARLGLRAGYLSRVGSDPFGDEIVRTLRGEGVDVSLVTRSPDRPTALMVKELRSADDVRVHYYRDRSAATELTAAMVEAVWPGARHAHTSGITFALGPGPAAAARELLVAARRSGATVSFDPNIRLKLWSLDAAVDACRGVIALVDDVLLSESEAMAITGAGDVEDSIERLADLGVPRVVVRRGAAGAIGAAGTERVEIAAQPAGRVVDSVGAGDAFTAGYLFERLSGRPLAEAMATGAWAAGLVVAHPGDYEGLPDRADYEAWRGLRETVQR
jgi:2-dehydro-3-deoxygluconokinase